MKAVMGSTKYASWNIEKAPLSDMYKKHISLMVVKQL